MFHTLWRREHNRIAKILALYNPEWSDELLFQEARRITVAEYQHITFNEFLPVVIGMHKLGYHSPTYVYLINDIYTYAGPKHAKKFNLFPKFEGFTQYNDSVDASVSNEHTTAAFRMGHSTIPDLLKIISDKKSVSTIDMKDAIEKPLKLIGDGVPDSVIRGMSRMSMGNVDEFASHQVICRYMSLITSLCKILHQSCFRAKNQIILTFHRLLVNYTNLLPPSSATIYFP